MDYQGALERLGKRVSKKVGNNTYLLLHAAIPGEAIHLRLHDTFVMTWFADGKVELNSGGWRTVTTKARINEFWPGLYVGNRGGIEQEKGVWYVRWNGKRYVFEEHMRLLPNGRVEGASEYEPEKEKEQLRLKKQARKYAKDFIQALKAGKVGQPDRGDCLYCQWREKETGKTMGEMAGDKDHILSHFEESYYVPSLLARACEVFPMSVMSRESLALGFILGTKDHPQHKEALARREKEHFERTYQFEVLEKNLYRYVCRELGFAT